VPEFSLDGVRPRVHPDAYLAPTAVLIGDVEVAEGASVWFGAVLRGDHARISVGPGSNVQDNVVVHCAEGLPTLVGAGVTIGHGACIEGCVVEDEAVVGTGAIMLQRSRLGRGALLAAGSLLSEGQEVPAGQLAAGVPATGRKEVSGSSARWVADAARHYVEAGHRFRRGLRPPD
jgi:carbonic anhydrase/acetyltransferase-like protein (isoleucine patch superfamily)